MMNVEAQRLLPKSRGNQRPWRAWASQAGSEVLDGVHPPLWSIADGRGQAEITHGRPSQAPGGRPARCQAGQKKCR